MQASEVLLMYIGGKGNRTDTQGLKVYTHTFLMKNPAKQTSTLYGLKLNSSL